MKLTLQLKEQKEHQWDEPLRPGLIQLFSSSLQKNCWFRRRLKERGNKMGKEKSSQSKMEKLKSKVAAFLDIEARVRKRTMSTNAVRIIYPSRWTTKLDKGSSDTIQSQTTTSFTFYHLFKNGIQRQGSCKKATNMFGCFFSFSFFVTARRQEFVANRTTAKCHHLLDCILLGPQ